MRLAPPGPPGWRRSAVALVAILALTSGLPARADDTQTVLLQEFNAYVRLTERTRVFFLGILEATARVPLPWEMWLVNRGRADLRDVDGEFSSRLRYRLGLEREFTMWGRTAVPYAQAEVFYD